ncbi:hypothetical protein N657DRAFT_569651 [Parathielavia appendiculata]|uniref:PCI domain-containing protein n=1 Tax=Parathielavia appendiculata TaxID=2587402 RepID=A0AAN6U5L2_9PEZI|nr:hypothetical protein N657DRAFT_569651 [Parathielavia appendiculata]
MSNLVVQFLSSIRGFVRELNGDELRNWLLVENEVASIYFEMSSQLKAGFPENSPVLEHLIDTCLPEEDNVPEGKGSPWPGFNSFIKEYLEYWRDVDFEDVVRLHSRLSNLVISCANALTNPTYGTVLLQTSMSLSESLSKLVMGLTRQPHLLAQIQGDTTEEDAGEKRTIVELAADIIQKIFTSCLTDRSSTRWSQPKGKKVAVYLFANLTLKLLFACDKSRLAVQMFTNLSTSGPALSLYPASQRVTFLYYLGRFNFDQGHYLRAHMCLEEAYRQCLPRFQKHRRQILTHWIPANLLLGRFPSLALLQRPEAAGFADIFLPICTAIRTGNFVAFHHALALNRDWLWEKGFYLTFLYRLKPLVWRSFTRKTFLLTWQGSGGDPSSNRAPQLSFEDLVTTAGYTQKLLEGYVPAKPPAPRSRPANNKNKINSVFLKAVTNSATAGGESSDAASSLLVSPPSGPRRLMPSEGLIFGNKKPDVENVESVVAGLVYSGLLNGFIARQQKRFAVEGAKKKGGNAVAAGWPNPYESILERFREAHQEALDACDSGESVEPPGEMDDVPGWVRNPP